MTQEYRQTGCLIGLLEERVRRVAAGLADRQIGRGDIVAILAAYRLPVLDHVFALSSLGAICAPLNVHLRGEALAHQLIDSNARAVVVDAATAQVVEPLMADLPGVELLILVEGEVPASAHPEKWCRHEDLLAAPEGGGPGGLAWNDPAGTLYTPGGAEGLPHQSSRAASRRRDHRRTAGAFARRHLSHRRAALSRRRLHDIGIGAGRRCRARCRSGVQRQRLHAPRRRNGRAAVAWRRVFGHGAARPARGRARPVP